MAVSKYSHEKELCQGNLCDSSRRGAITFANVLANIANVCIPLGAIGIGYGAYELSTLPSAETARAEQRAWHVMITGMGATIRGTL
jgi:hypothetical protein